METEILAPRLLDMCMGESTSTSFTRKRFVGQSCPLFKSRLENMNIVYESFHNSLKLKRQKKPLNVLSIILILIRRFGTSPRASRLRMKSGGSASKKLRAANEELALQRNCGLGLWMFDLKDEMNELYRGLHELLPYCIRSMGGEKWT